MPYVQPGVHAAPNVGGDVGQPPASLATTVSLREVSVAAASPLEGTTVLAHPPAPTEDTSASARAMRTK